MNEKTRTAERKSGSHPSEYFSKADERVVGTVELGERECVVTNERLLVTDRDGHGNVTIDIRHSDVSEIDVGTSVSPKRLYWATGALTLALLCGGTGYGIWSNDASTIAGDLASRVSSSTTAAEVAGAVVALELVLFAVAGLGLLGALIAVKKHFDARRPVLVVGRVNRTSYDLAAPTKDEARKAKVELEKLYDKI